MQRITMVLLLCACIMFVAPASAIYCYSCTTYQSTGTCSDPFTNSSSVGTCNTGAVCVKAKSIVSGVTSIVRSCSPDLGTGNVCEISGASTACVCSTDFCNAAHQLSMKTYSLLMLLMVLLIITYIVL